MKKALVVVDAQNDFTFDALKNKEAIAALPVIREILNFTREKRKDFMRIFTRDTHDENYLNTQEGQNLPIPHCIINTKGWQICDAVAPEADEIIYNKGTFGTFGFYPMLEDVDEIWICGFCTDICVSANFQILKALYPEVPIYVIEDACAGVTPELHEAALKIMGSCQAKVVTWNKLKEAQ